MSKAPSLLLSAAPLLLVAVPATAQAGRDELHRLVGPDILVTAPFERDRFEIPTATSVLEGEALVRAARGTLGETLARQPGVSASWFGPNASRPILRGLDAERVRVLTDGIGSFDVANTSPDHAVAINPLIVDRVEVIRGPASLLYGSGAIGGVVNVTDRRIPRSIPGEALHLDGTGTLGSAARERGIAGHADVPLGRTGLVAHADGSYLRADNLRTGGYIFSRALREAAAAAGGEAADDARARGRIENTDSRSWQAAAGLAWIGAGGSFGFAVSRIESNYGIPNGLDLDDHGHDHDEDHDHDHDHAHGHEDIRLDLRQTRVDARAEVPMSGAFERLRVRFGWADYRHDEIEDMGEIGTSFFNEALEGRIELVQAPRNGWRGATGAQLLHRRFEAVGEEAYIPLNLTDQVGLFTLQSFDLGQAFAELGARWEHTNVRSPALGVERRFDAFSASAGLSLPLAEGLRLAGSLAWSERAPAAEELFADGAHAATRAFEIGDPELRKERSFGAEASLRGRGAGWRFELSGFFNRFRNFIYLQPTGAVEDGLPVFEYRQAGARFWGLEADGAVTLARLGDMRIEATGLVDVVRADLLGGRGPVPRIPPLRLIGGLEATGERMGGRFEVEHVTRADRLAAFETETPAYTLVNASLAWRPFGRDNPTALVASVNNILDVEARRHASFLKDVAPLPGRDVRLAARFSF